MIQIFLTGGTIDKYYNQSNGAMEFNETHIPQILEQGRNRAKTSIEQLLFKDSLDMTAQDRALVADACANSDATKIVITHGTDTMVETAQQIARDKPEVLEGKTIVLVGAMIPYEIRYSDASFNMAFALGAVSALSAGIYIAMNGEIFDYANVRKNRDELMFE